MSENRAVEVDHERSLPHPIRLGFFLGSMSGPGSGAYSRIASLLGALSNQELEILVYGLPLQLSGLPKAANLRMREVGGPSRLSRYLTTGFRVRRLARKDQLDFLQFETLPVPRHIRSKVLFSIHHLEPVDVVKPRTTKDSIKRTIRMRVTRSAARRAFRVITLTEWSKQDIMSRFDLSDDRVTAIPFALGSISAHPAGASFQNAVSKYGTFVLALGHLEGRKNLQILIRASASQEWPSGVSLVLAGGDQGQRLQLQHLASQLEANVIFAGPVHESVKNEMLSKALCLAMPSLLEGFGIPVVEAVAAGTPALVSDRTALPEVVGVREAVISASSASDWARAIRELADSGERRQELLVKERKALDRYQSNDVALAYLNSLGQDPQSAKTRCDILHLAYGGTGGHRSVIEELSKALSLSSIRSGVIFVSPKGNSSQIEDPTGLSFIEHAQLKRRADLSSMIKVFRLVKAQKPACVIAHTHRHASAAWFGQLLSTNKPKLVLVEHQSLYLRSLSDELNSLVALLFSRAIVFLTDEYRRQYRLISLAQFFRKQVFVIRNGVELPPEGRNRAPFNDRPIVLGMACRLIPSKNLSSLIRAMPLLAERGSWELRIAGDGPARDSLESLVNDLGLQDMITFEGSLDRSLMPAWYQSLDCYVHVSRGETMSMAVIEAASYGLPIIATQEPGIQAYFDPSTTITPIRDPTPENISVAVSTLMGSQSFRSKGLAARAVVKETFSSRAMASSYLNVLESINALRPQNLQDALERLKGAPS